LLETLREYALERLEASGEEGALRRRHAVYFMALAEEAEPELRGSKQARWLERLEREHGNLRAALGWALQQGEVELGLRLAAALYLYWDVRGYFGEGREWLEQFLVLSSSDETRHSSRAARAKALNRLGNLAHAQGDFTQAIAWQEESLALW